MIKKYKKYNEGIKSLLVGPTEQEVLNGLFNTDDDLHTLIWRCCKLNFLKGIEYLYDNYDLTDDVKESGLYFSSLYGYLDIVKYIVKKGVDVNTEKGAPLRNACRIGYSDITEFLLENGANTYLDVYQTASQFNHKDCMDLVKKYLVGEDW